VILFRPLKLFLHQSKTQRNDHLKHRPAGATEPFAECQQGAVQRFYQRNVSRVAAVQNVAQAHMRSAKGAQVESYMTNRSKFRRALPASMGDFFPRRSINTLHIPAPSLYHVQKRDTKQ